MSLSSQNITANQHLYRALLTQWESTQPPARGFESSVDTASRREDKDVIVAFRTRPPLERELIRFESEKSPASDAESDVSEPVTVENFKAGINVISAEPGVMVAHVPGMKVHILRMHVHICHLLWTCLVERSYFDPEDL